MKKWLEEDYEFTITILSVGPEDNPFGFCRMGFEVGNVFVCKFDTPAGFCPKSMAALYTWCEVARCGGDFRLRGSKSSDEVNFNCADGCVKFHLIARKIDETNA